MLIYQLIDPRDEEPRYVGFTTKETTDDRLKDHYFEKGNTPKNAWLKKLKKLGLRPKTKTLEHVNKDNWQERERYWIALHRQVGFNMKNTLPGGEHGPILRGQKHSEKHRLNAARAKRLFSMETCVEIYEKYLMGKNYLILAKEYGVSRHTIMRSCKRAKFNTEESCRNLPKNTKKELTSIEVKEIKQLLRQGKLNQREIAEIYKINSSSVSNIKRNKNYKNVF